MSPELNMEVILSKICFPKMIPNHSPMKEKAIHYSSMPGSNISNSINLSEKPSHMNKPWRSQAQPTSKWSLSYQMNFV